VLLAEEKLVGVPAAGLMGPSLLQLRKPRGGSGSLVASAGRGTIGSQQSLLQMSPLGSGVGGTRRLSLKVPPARVSCGADQKRSQRTEGVGSKL
jgi:hypothetical protein